MLNSVTETNFENLKLIHRGKVRDLYEVEGDLLMVASDRISAYDVVMNEPIPNKGAVLTTLSLFWFDFLKDIVRGIWKVIWGRGRYFRSGCPIKLKGRAGIRAGVCYNISSSSSLLTCVT